MLSSTVSAALRRTTAGCQEAQPTALQRGKSWLVDIFYVIEHLLSARPTMMLGCWEGRECSDFPSLRDPRFAGSAANQHSQPGGGQRSDTFATVRHSVTSYCGYSARSNSLP